MVFVGTFAYNTTTMTLQELNQSQKKVKQLLRRKRVLEALNLLHKLASAAGDYHLVEQQEQLVTAYGYMLQYVAKGVHDPKRNDILSDIIEKSYTLTDRCIIAISQDQSLELFYTRQSAYQPESLRQHLHRYQTILNQINLLKTVSEDLQDQVAIQSHQKEKELKEVDIFNKIWLSFPLGNEDTECLKELFQREEYSPILKSFITSALFLGLTKFYDERKLALLLEIYSLANDIEIQTRALTTAVIAMYLFRYRVECSRHLKEIVDSLAEHKHFKSDLIAILNRLIHTRDTENITKHLREEVIPDIMKMSPNNELKDKPTLDLSDLENNPQWQEWLDNSGVTKRIEELNEIQMEGGDLYISTFAKLKSFPFFNTMPNWFMPYDDTHSTVEASLSQDDKSLRELIACVPFLCDSDKYSFCFSMATVPPRQRALMRNQFDAQNTNIKEMAHDDLPNHDTELRDQAVKCYVQDLYRFFKLYSRRHEFLSIFNSSMDFLELPFLPKYFNDKINITVIAEFYMKHGFYEDAIKYYRHELDTFKDIDPLVLQKIGFAYQNLGNYSEAVTFYRRYELANDTDSWNLRHIASCYRSMKELGLAIQYYQKAEALAPHNASLCLSIGHCLLEQGQTEEALQYYFKADYLDHGKHRAWRPIAWCSYITGNYAQSERYYKKLIDNNIATSQDYLNYGHLLLTQHQLEDAISQYVKSVHLAHDDLDGFMSNYAADRHYLLDKGIDEVLITLIGDSVAKQLKDTP